MRPSILLQADPTVKSGPTAGTSGEDVTLTVTINTPVTYGLREWCSRSQSSLRCHAPFEGTHSSR